MATSYKVIKVVNNNIVRARDINDSEVILIGKGVGFSKKTNDYISSVHVEDTFILRDKKETSLYKQLLQTTSPKLIDLSNEVISYIQKNTDKPLNEHIHIALTDHIAFLVRRCKMGIPIDNPFLYETSNLYPKETQIAKNVIEMLNYKLNLDIPESEVGFITLHIISSVTNMHISDIQSSNMLIKQLVGIIEKQVKFPLNKKTLVYSRLMTHLRFAIERINRGETIKTPLEFESVVEDTCPECYALALKLTAVMQNELKKHVNKSEAVYLSLHIYQLITKS